MKMTPDENGLLYTAKLTPRDKELVNDPNINEINWRHMCALHQQTRVWLKENTELDKNVIDVMLAEDTRPRILIKDQGVLLIFRAINYNDPEHPEDMISLRIWIDPHNIYTTRRRDLKTIEDIKMLIEAGSGPQRAGEFLTMITSQLYVRMEPFIDELEDTTAKCEELVTVGDFEDAASDTALVRRRTAIYRRYIMPQRGVLEGLYNSNLLWLFKKDKEQLVESHDSVLRYVEILNDLKERTLILNEEVRNIHAEKLSSTSYIFSIAATIFLPLGFLTGLMGINIGGMPGVDSPIAFWSFAGLCAAIIIVQVLVFRKLKWF